MQRGQNPESDTWTDEEIIRAVESAPYLEGSDDKLVQISGDTVVKLGRDWDSTTSEVLAMELVRNQTRIPIPHKRCAIRHHHSEGNGLIVMDLVPNSQQLRVAWPSLSFLGKLKVSLTMRRYLCQLRRIQYSSSNNTPGPPGPTPYLAMAFNSAMMRKVHSQQSPLSRLISRLNIASLKTVPLEAGHLPQTANPLIPLRLPPWFLRTMT
jgi:hypothetical protein